MAVKYQIHSTTKRAAIIIAAALAIFLVAQSIRKFSRENNTPPVSNEIQSPIATPSYPLLTPVIELSVLETEAESSWSNALAAKLGGNTEVAVRGGRVDVLSDFYAIEVDWLEKWHEGIGQASHYSLSTGKPGVLALVITGNWPPDEKTLKKLSMIDQVATKSEIRLLVLRKLSN